MQTRSLGNVWRKNYEVFYDMRFTQNYTIRAVQAMPKYKNEQMPSGSKVWYDHG